MTRGKRPEVLTEARRIHARNEEVRREFGRTWTTNGDVKSPLHSEPGEARSETRRGGPVPHSAGRAAVLSCCGYGEAHRRALVGPGVEFRGAGGELRGGTHPERGNRAGGEQ